MSFSKQFRCLSFYVDGWTRPLSQASGFSAVQKEAERNSCQAKRGGQQTGLCTSAKQADCNSKEFLIRFFFGRCIIFIVFEFFFVRLLFSFFKRVSDVCCITMPGFMTQCEMWFVQDLVFHKCGSLKVLPWKLTCPLKINGWKMYSLLK